MGEDLERDKTIAFPFKRTLDRFYSESDLIFYDKLIYSESKVAPTYPGPDIRTSCFLKSDLRHVSRNAFKDKTGPDGEAYTEVNYILVLSTAAANMRFFLMFDGVEIGSVQATYT